VCIGDAICGSKENLASFSMTNVEQLDQPAQPALIRLLTVALHAPQLKERMAALRAFRVRDSMFFFCFFFFFSFIFFFEELFVRTRRRSNLPLLNNYSSTK
jgi:hypothetical protein